jgi:glycosyltransferase involved in cell wall biosynthesis
MSTPPAPDNAFSVSVVIPSRNAACWLERALDSVSKQSVLATEVILIDDGSTDGTPEVARNHPLKITINQVNLSNAAAARNIGIEQASGKWIAFLDADDEWYPHHLERVALADRAGDIGYLNVFDRIYADSDAIHAVPQPANWPMHLTHGLTGDYFVHAYLRAKWFPGMSGLAMQKELLKHIGGLDPKQLRRHDIEVWLRALSHGGKWTFDDTPGNKYRADTPGAISRNLASRELYLLHAVLSVANLYQEDEINSLVKQCSRRALATALTDGGTSDIRKAYEEAIPYASTLDRYMFLFFKRVPQLFRALNLLRRQIVKLGN